MKWLLICLAILIPSTLVSQIASNESWRTFRTPHFRVHFPADLEPQARRAGVEAEKAYENLARELVTPRGVIDLVITDAVDGSNGTASIFPSNRIIIQIRPPVDNVSLQGYQDWFRLVIQHEVAHIFHLDRARGWWGLAQKVVGRNPFTFPNVYTPAWIIEGIAVYYESRFDEGGRLHGSYIPDLVRTFAQADALPALNELSLARSRYPMGQGSYSFGALMFAELAGRAGPESVRRYIENTSSEPIPYSLNHVSRHSFNESFSDAWAQWRDSVIKATPPLVTPADDWKVIETSQRYTSFPRWWNDSTLTFVVNDGREPVRLYSVTGGSNAVPLSHRNSADANSRRYDGAIVFGQVENIDRFNIKSDLFEERDGSVRRLTSNQRLSAPDVRSDGEIVAVQGVAASTNIVTLSPDGSNIRVIAAGSPTVQWSAPRWSPDGRYIAAARYSSGSGAIVIFDNNGALLYTIGMSAGIATSPAWTSDGKSILFISDRSGVPRVYHANTDPVSEPRVVGRIMETGVYEIDVVNDPDRPGIVKIASVFQDVKGFRLATWTVDLTNLDQASIPDKQDIIRPEAETRPLLFDSLKSTRYRAWRSLLPTYWAPLVDNSGGNGWRLGASTSGSDVIGRHSYFAQAIVNTGTHNLDLSATYSYGRLVNPVILFSADQSWSYSTILSDTTIVGNLTKRARVYSVRTQFVRPRFMSYSAFTLGAELETDMYTVLPDSLTSEVPQSFVGSHSYPVLLAGFQFNNALKPSVAISAQDGISFSASVRQRWKSGTSGEASRGVVAVTALYKSFDLFGGYAKHVLALRLAGGVSDNRSPTDYSVGGISGGSLEVFPGLTIGDQNRTFPVRGFAPSAQRGVRAYSAALEYRIPLTIPGKGLWMTPLFLDRTSLSLFADAGRAFCAGSGAPACAPSSFNNSTLASVGGELNLDAALQYDTPYRFRLGIARPVRSIEYAPRSTSFYLSFGTNY